MSYEKSIKVGDKYVFVGWESNIDKEFTIEEKETSKFIYVTNKYLNGAIEEVRYRKEV